MSAQGTIKRYLLIVEKIASAKFPSLERLKSHLADHGFDISERTLQRNIEQIRYEFGLEIKYNRQQNGYFIDKHVSINVDAFMRFLEIVGTADLLTESLKAGKDILNYVSFETDGTLKGIENLKLLLFAVKNHRKILFIHQNFETGKKKKYRISPYLLKEYQNRWYIVGLIQGIEEFRTFGIDRMQNIEVLTDTFKSDSKLNPVKLFENIVGLTYSKEKPEQVILSFTLLQSKYIQALPLHRSQEVIKQTKKEVLIRLTVIPNFELEQKILMLGDNIKILKPEWLKNEIINKLRKTLKKYE